MSSLQGLNVVVDLSHFNQVTSFQEIQQSGIVGVIHKATEGTGWPIQLMPVVNRRRSPPDFGGAHTISALTKTGQRRRSIFCPQ